MNSLYSTVTDLVSVKERKHQIIRKDKSQSISSILELLNGCPSRQSNIAQKSGLTYKHVKNYVRLLTGCNLLYYDEHELTYKTTPKGLHYLNLQNNLIDLLPPTNFKSGQRTEN